MSNATSQIQVDRKLAEQIVKALDNVDMEAWMGEGDIPVTTVGNAEIGLAFSAEHSDFGRSSTTYIKTPQGRFVAGVDEGHVLERLADGTAIFTSLTKTGSVYDESIKFSEAGITPEQYKVYDALQQTVSYRTLEKDADTGWRLFDFNGDDLTPHDFK